MAGATSARKSRAQSQLIMSLCERDIETFTKLLDDPRVDPDHWYGKPYWGTCLAIACREKDCGNFVNALLHHGAGSTRRTFVLTEDRKTSIRSKHWEPISSKQLKLTLGALLEVCNTITHNSKKIEHIVNVCLTKVQEMEEHVVSLEKVQKRNSAMVNGAVRLLQSRKP